MGLDDWKELLEPCDKVELEAIASNLCKRTNLTVEKLRNRCSPFQKESHYPSFMDLLRTYSKDELEDAVGEILEAVLELSPGFDDLALASIINATKDRLQHEQTLERARREKDRCSFGVVTAATNSGHPHTVFRTQHLARHIRECL